MIVHRRVSPSPQAVETRMLRPSDGLWAPSASPDLGYGLSPPVSLSKAGRASAQREVIPPDIEDLKRVAD